jgi:hypothetical protein
MKTFKRILLTILELFKLLIFFGILIAICGVVAYVASFNMAVTNVIMTILVALMCIGGLGTIVWYVYEDTKDKIP